MRIENNNLARWSVLVLFLFLIQSQALPAPSRFQDTPRCLYRSPAPAATLIRPETNLILRFDVPVAPTSLTNVKLRVEGSSSGPVTGTLLLSDDDVTVLYQPSRPFVTGEKVHVTLPGGIKSTDGTDMGSLDWQFTISSTPSSQTGVNALTSLTEEMGKAPHSKRPNPGNGLARIAGDLPFDFPSITVPIDSTTLSGGLYLSNLSFDKTLPNIPYLMILKESGDPFFYRELPDLGLDFKRQDNGWYTYFLTGDNKFVVLDSSFQKIGTYKAGNGYATDVHELRILPNGHGLLLALDPENVDMRALTPGGSSSAVVIGMILQEVDLAGNVIFQWRTWDHFSITDATLTDLTASLIDPFHCNAIEIDGDGNLLLSSRHLDQITKINRITGNIMWRLGGRNNQFTLLGDTLWFSHQHSIRRLLNGHYILFDNGNGHTPPFSRVIEFVLDTAARTCQYVWQYARPGTFSLAMGYVQRLENGNTFIGWGATSPAVSVVTPDGKTVYELWLPGGIYSYRASLAAWAPPPGFANRGNPVPQGFTLKQNYPNPFNPTTMIEYEVPYPSHVTLIVYNDLGEQVSVLADRQVDEGVHYALFNGSGFASGVYFCRLQAGGYAETRKLLLVK